MLITPPPLVTLGISGAGLGLIWLGVLRWHPDTWKSLLYIRNKNWVNELLISSGIGFGWATTIIVGTDYGIGQATLHFLLYSLLAALAVVAKNRQRQ